MTKPIRYAALGDSLTAGFGAPPGFGFADRYRELAESSLGVPILLDNAGVNGATSADLLSALEGDPRLAELVRNARILTLTIGGNDLLEAAKRFYFDSNVEHLLQALKQCRDRLARILGLIRSQKRAASAAKPYLMRMIDLYNPIPFFAESVEWVQRFNRMYRRFEAADLKVCDIYSLFVGREVQLLSDDLIHPNAAGYWLMAERVHALGYEPLERRLPGRPSGSMESQE